VYIIDHHRIGGKVEVATDDTVFIDTTASSTTAILTEMIIGTNNEEIFDPKIATLLLAGVYLDTNELTRNTSARTHDVISQLIKAGADSEQASSSLQTSIEDIPLITAALNSSVKLGRKTLISVMPENKILNDTDVSSLADMLLEYKGIDAGFVLARIKGNKYKLSARSNEKINVQLVAEALNGGGHFNSSAAT
jgi:c-di-AMP phosphodiesterase-like protein